MARPRVDYGNLVSHHARTRTLGLATSRRDGKIVLYRLTGSGLAALLASMEAGV